MKSGFARKLRPADAGLATAIVLCLVASPLLAQPGQGQGSYNIDSRAEERS